MTELRFRAPGTETSLHELVDRALAPRSVGLEDLQALCAAGDVEVDGVLVRDERQLVRAGSAVRVMLAGVDEPNFIEVSQVAGGVALRGDSEEAGWTVRVLLPAPPWRRGFLAAQATLPELHFERLDEREGVAELALRFARRRDSESFDAPVTRLDRLRRVSRRLGVEGWPVLGDAHHGGILVAGGVRARCHDSVEPRGWWPEGPVFPGVRAIETWRVSSATRRAVERGHPWLLDDEQGEDTSRFAPGTLVAAADDRGGFGLALTDGSRRVAGRMWARDVQRVRDASSVEERVARAVERRRELLPFDPDTGSDVVRVVHGEADGLPGLAIDRIGPLLRVLQSSRACEAFVERAIDACLRCLAPWLGAAPPVIQLLHLRDRPKGELECVTAARGVPADVLDAQGRLVVSERGLRFRVDPGWSTPSRSSPGFGLYADQRDNRCRLVRHAQRGGRWLNLFAHTGAFSVALLAAGAGEVVSVDLSRGYLRWLEENLALNAVDTARHESVKQEGRRFLERVEAAAFDGIVLDPPTAAAAGRQYWSVDRDLEAMIRQAHAKLSPGGVLLVTRNRQSKRRSLRACVEKAGRWQRLEQAPPASDFPRLRGFPEGDAFEGILAERR